MKLKTKIALGVAILVGLMVIVFIIRNVASSTKYIPQEFVEAKARSAEIAQRITNLSSQSLSGLEQINNLDKSKDYSEAVILASNKLVQNRETREEAIKLASQMEKMAAGLPEIKPAKARQIATEAIGYEVALVSRLISYNDFFNQLFDTLIKKFKNEESDANSKTQELINKINDEAQAINELNSKFNRAIAELDKVFSQ